MSEQVKQVPVEVFFKLQLTGFVHRFAEAAHMVATHNRRPDQVLDERLEPIVALATAVWESVATTFGEEWCKATESTITLESGDGYPRPCEHWGWAHVDGYCVGCIRDIRPEPEGPRIVDEQFRPQHAYSVEPDIWHEHVSLYDLRDAGLERWRKWLAEHPEVTKESDEDAWWTSLRVAAESVVPTDDVTLKRLALEDGIWEAKLDQPGENVRATVRSAIEQAVEVHAQKQPVGARS